MMEPQVKKRNPIAQKLEIQQLDDEEDDDNDYYDYDEENDDNKEEKGIVRRPNGFRPSIFDGEEITKWKIIEISNLRRTWKTQELQRLFDARGWPIQRITDTGGMKRDKATAKVPEEIAGAIVRELAQTQTNLYIKGHLAARIVIGTTIADRRQQELEQPEEPPPLVKKSISEIRRTQKKRVNNLN